MFFQKVDPTDPRSINVVKKNRAYAVRRGLHFFDYKIGGFYEKVYGAIQDAPADECDGFVVLWELEPLTVNGLEKSVEGRSYFRRGAKSGFGLAFFRNDKEGLEMFRQDVCGGKAAAIQTEEKKGPETKETKKQRKTKTTKSKKDKD